METQANHNETDSHAIPMVEEAFYRWLHDYSISDKVIGHNLEHIMKLAFMAGASTVALTEDDIMQNVNDSVIATVLITQLHTQVGIALKSAISGLVKRNKG